MWGLLEVGGGGANIGGRQSVLLRQNISNRIYTTAPFSALVMVTMTMTMAKILIPRQNIFQTTLCT